MRTVTGWDLHSQSRSQYVHHFFPRFLSSHLCSGATNDVQIQNSADLSIGSIRCQGGGRSAAAVVSENASAINHEKYTEKLLILFCSEVRRVLTKYT